MDQDTHNNEARQIKRQPPDPNGRFPHFIEHDARLWQRFLNYDHLPEALVAYDVHVGSPCNVPPDFPPAYARMVGLLSTKRIDVVIFFPTETAIVEVKPYAGLAAIGQALSYRKLFQAQFPNEPAPFPCIITDTAQPDMTQLCTQLAVTLLELDHLENSSA